MSDKNEDKKDKWVNDLAKIWKKKNKKGFFMSIPLAEPVTLKLQRATKYGIVIQEVTLIPETNENGYSSVSLQMKEPESYEKDGKTIDPPSNLKYTLSLPPQSSGDGESDF